MTDRPLSPRRPPTSTAPQAQRTPTRSENATKTAHQRHLSPLPTSSIPATPPTGRLQQPPNKLAASIQALTDRTRTARETLSRLTNITAGLRDQCALQESECEALEVEKARVRQELQAMIKRVEDLVSEKTKVEHKLEELKKENARLEDVLQESEGVAKESLNYLKQKPV